VAQYFHMPALWDGETMTRIPDAPLDPPDPDAKAERRWRREQRIERRLARMEEEELDYRPLKQLRHKPDNRHDELWQEGE